MKSSLRKKLIIFLLAATILPISISMLITYQQTTSSITEQTVKDNSKLLFQGKSNLLNYFALLNKLSVSVYNDSMTGDTLFRIIRDGVSSESDSYLDEMEIASSLRGMAKTSPDIYQIRLHIDEGDRTYLLVNDLVRSDTKVASAQDRNIEWKPSGYMQPTHLSHTYGINQQRKYTFYFPRNVISLHRPILNMPTDRQIGLLSIDVKLDYIQSIAEVLNTGESEELWILDDKGQVIYNSDEGTIGTTLHEPWVSNLFTETSERGQYQIKSESFDGIVVYEKLNTAFMNWTIVKRVPYDQLYGAARQLTRINSLVFGCFLLVTVLATIYISYRITKPIKRLTQSIQVMQSGNLQVDIPIETQDEIGIFSRRFRQLMDQINHLILREYRLELANKTNQLKALQAQVHPHFLNNALQSIGTLALQHKDRKVYTLIASLGKLMRYHMNTEEAVVPLAKEIEHVKAYTELQKQRFGEALDVRFDIDPEAENVEVPKMIVQPLVENVFKHGVKRPDTMIGIRVRCTKLREGILQIEVADNGNGMEPELLLRLQEQLDHADSAAASPKDDHIGLANVLMRLRLFFNESASLRLQPNDGGGLIVTLVIPIAEGVNIA